MTSRISYFLFILLYQLSVRADCSSASAIGTSLTSGKVGEIRLSSGGTLLNKLMFCDGTNWQDFPGSPTATSCTTNGLIQLEGTEVAYCNLNKKWLFDSGSTTNGGCTSSGTIRWNAGVEFCNGTSWRTVPSDSSPDAFTFSTYTNTDWEFRSTETVQVTGFSGGTANMTFNAATCTSVGAYVCSDLACTNMIGSRTTNGSVAVPNGAYLRLAFLAANAASTTCSIAVTLGDKSATLSTTTAATDTTVAYSATFNDNRGAAASSLQMSNIVKTTSHSDVTASVSGPGSPEFRTCSDATCATPLLPWGSTSRTLSNNDYIQLRATAGTGSFSLNTVSLSAGTGSNRSWNLMTSDCPLTTSLAPGATLTCNCPASYLLIQRGASGSGNYRQTSDVCSAALHRGAVSNATGGSVTVVGTTAGSPSGTCPSFTGSSANGVSTSSGASGTSMYFSGFGTDVCN